MNVNKDLNIMKKHLHYDPASIVHQITHKQGTEIKQQASDMSNGLGNRR